MAWPPVLRSQAWYALFSLALILCMCTFAQAQTIAYISPTVAPAGMSVTISGNGFGASQGSSTVKFNGVAGTPTSWSNSSIVVPVPAAATNGPVTVVVGGTTSNGVTFGVQPTITWPTPTAITSGTALSAAQLNASASVQGTFAYMPAAGTIPAAGTAALSVIFTPSDTTSYSAVAATVPLQVNGDGPIIQTVAGNGTAGFAGDGGPATSSEVFGPNGIAFDSAGNLYIADSYNGRIRKISASTGLISTVAGNGTAGYSGDGGPALSAAIGARGIAVDGSGNIYMADSGDNVVRKVTASTGIITTVAGNGTTGFAGDGGSATSAQLNGPFAVAVDSAGNLYIADGGNNRIRKVTSSGTISTVAGNGTGGFAGDGGAATTAELYDPVGVALDSAGNLYIADQYNDRIRKVTTTGIISTVAGGGITGYMGDGGPATSTSIQWTTGVLVDAVGNIYFSDKNGGRVRKVTAATGLVSTIAGNGTLGYNGDDIVATSAELTYPEGIALDAAGNLYFADNGNNRVRELNLSGIPKIIWPTPAAISYGTPLSTMQLNATASVQGTFSYTPAAGTIPAPGTATLSVIFTPYDTTNYKVAAANVSLQVNGNGPVIQTVAGTGSIGYSGDGGLAANATVYGPNGIAFDSAGNLYIADTYNNRIRKISASTGLISTVAGNGTFGYSGDNGSALSAAISARGIAVDGSGNIYMADGNHNVVRKVTASTGIITTVAGNGTAGFAGDGGSASSAELNSPFAVAVDSAGNLYIADGGNNRIRKVTSSGTISTVAGNGTGGFAGDGGAATTAELYDPVGVALDSAGNLYIADQYNGRVRKVTGGVITTVVGGALSGYVGDGGLATSTSIGWTTGVAVDSAGNIYFSDKNAGRVRKVTAATNLVSTLAGFGTLGYNGDGITATSAELTYPEGIALDAAGNLYFADNGNNRVRVVSLMRAAPTVSWSSPAPITTGTPLGAAQLNATADLPGTFTYSPAAGAVLPAGTQILSVTFTPTNTFDYSSTTQTVAITVQANPTITWPSPPAITYGTALSATQLNAASAVPGTFVYSPAPGTTLAAGTQTLSVAFTPVDTTNYTTATASVSLSVQKATPTITWPTLSAISYGTALSGTQLDATSSVPGTFAYSPAAGTVLPAGTQTLSVTFTPTDNTDYASVTQTVSLTISQITPTVSWSTPAAITYGTTLSATQLNATASVPGTFSYTPASGTMPSTGTEVLSALFTPSDTTNYSTATQTVQLVVNKAVPAIAWTAPGSISYGTALSSTQLNATASVPGTFSYTPSAGTILPAGTNTLSVVFTPSDTNDYDAASANVPITVNGSNPGSIETVAGNGTNGYSGNGGLAINAKLSAPDNMVVDSAGNIYIADYGNCLIRKVTASTGYISNVAGIAPGGSGSNCGYNGDGISATSAKLDQPSGVALDADGNIYITDTLNCIVRKVTLSTGLISTVAGTIPNSNGPVCGDLSGSNSAQIYLPQGIAVDPARNIYVTAAYRVLQITSSGVVSTVAGNGNRGSGGYGDGGSATSAELWGPTGVALDGNNNIYIADEADSRIRKVTVSTGTISTVVGNGTAGFSGDGGAATSAELDNPWSLAVDSFGNIYIADSANSLIRTVTASTGYISTVAAGSLYNPLGVAMDSAGNLYIADTYDNRIREVVSARNPSLTISTSATPSTYGGSVTLTAAISSGPTGTMTFYDGGTAIGTATISGTTATLAISTLTAGSHTITAAWGGNSNYNAVTSGAVVQTVNRAIPTITWPTPVFISYGTALSSTQLNAASSAAGSFAYSPGAGTTLGVGAHTITATFTPNDPVDYTTATASVTLMVNQATPAITWPNPANIKSGTALSATQLNASSPVPGTFVYSPTLGTLLSTGPHTLTVTFTPTDTTDYTSATATALLTVTSAADTWDSGTVSLTVNNTTVATAGYGQGSTPSTIAEALAANVSSSSPVNVTAVDDAIYIEAKTGGSASNYSYSLQTTSYSSSIFGQPSFFYPPISGLLDGGADQNTSGTTVYNFSVPSGGYDGVGNLKTYTDSVMGAWAFNYDTLNRLTTATDNQPNNPNGYYCWGYDAFGNRTVQAGSSAAFVSGSPNCTPASGASVTSAWANLSSANNNQLASTSQAPAGVTYDAAGNVLNDGMNQYLYDGDGRICAVASTPIPSMTIMTGYIYDASGQRVAKGTISTWSCDPTINGFTTTNAYILGPSGEQLTEMGMDANNTIAWQHTNIYAAGKLFATYDDNGLHFYLNDPLGTRRAQTDYAGVLEQTCSSLPFGDNLSCTNSAQYPTEHHFTGKERDTESGNDYFGARYYASSMARFISPDSSEGPDPVPFGDLGDPQSLNLYTYLTNNPLSNVDDDGHDGAAPAATCGGGIGGLVCRLRQALRGGGAGGGSNPPSPPPPSPPGVPEGAPGTPTGPLMQAQQNARSNPRFQPIPGGATFCNMASCYIGQHVPGTNMSPLMTNGVPNLANTDANTLAHSGNYHQIGRAEAQRIANTGKVVYGVYKEPGHGHIVTVAPDNTYFGQAYFPNHNPNDPLINDIGRHIGVYPLSQQPSSGFRNEVIFYAPN